MEDCLFTLTFVKSILVTEIQLELQSISQLPYFIYFLSDHFCFCTNPSTDEGL